ncbi:transmembrane protein 107-like isoform X2 [Pomacea canaliculata]|uniref:transmembrane protein 107-like isoform X2 n=1 Tax=Pomacea canaliculata TaxID=400727 RepID=UPI000D72C9BD|nr:transmembrane protein 107-like isoform X2 [Pomacea canaliculata]
MKLTGLVPARFLTIVAHLIIVIVIFWSRDENVRMCLPETYTQDDYNQKDVQMIIGLSVTLGLFVLELIGFMGGLTMFFPFQSLLSTFAHTGAAVALSYFLFDAWPCDWYWYIFGFCSAFPAVTEIITILGILCFRKGL